MNKKFLLLAFSLLCISCKQSQSISSNLDTSSKDISSTLDASSSNATFSTNQTSLLEKESSEDISSEVTQSASIKDERYRKIAFAIVSSAENSTLNYNENYAYIEDINDERGYTAGIIGFTTGTGDLIEVVKQYLLLKPNNNILEKYLSTLEKLIGSSSTKGLGKQFEKDWQEACKDQEMIVAQNYIVETMYLNPAIEYAKEDGLSLLGQFVYYDAIVMHGCGDQDDGESFEVMLYETRAKASSPSNNGSEKEFLSHFFEARKKMMLKEEAHEDLDRIEAQKKFLNEGKFNLELPLSWTMYGDSFTLTEYILNQLN